MSFVGYFSTALSGLNAQSQALSAISNNIANSRTTGYRRVDTNFEALVTEASRTTYQSGGVIASPLYANAVNGTTETTGIDNNQAIAGNGFFVVSKPTSVTTAGTSFEDRDYYTRAGDFQLNADGYLENGSGYYAQAYKVDPTTGLATGSIGEMQVTDKTMAPAPSTAITCRVGLPADIATGKSVTSSVDVFDSLGSSHSVDLTWTKTAANTWSLAANSADDTTATTANFTVTFNTDGTLASATPAPLSLSVTYPGAAAQTLALDFGTAGSASGLTQYSGTAIELNDLSADGYAKGSFSALSIDQEGYVTLNYDNGESKVAYQLALANFNAPQNLQTVDGQAFLATQAAGTPLVGHAGQYGLGTLVGSAVESSNVDIGEEFTGLITTQRAYSANAKVLTTVDEMLQDILNAKR
ncbi:flagellar hook protein FlgE [Zavarzinia sp.]|uniref:flagellar hook protein FlgE n=1 Tax=Zavarzinia sp. TaxID=2027920 RepID=UPI003565F75E